MATIEELNELANKCFPTDDAFDYVSLVDYQMDSAVQVIPLDAEAFQITTNVGKISDLVSFDDPQMKNALISNQKISYAWIVRLMQDENKFRTCITRLIEEITKSMSKYRNDLKHPLSKPKVRIKFPDGKMFRDCEDSAAFNFRVFLEEIK